MNEIKSTANFFRWTNIGVVYYWKNLNEEINKV